MSEFQVDNHVRVIQMFGIGEKGGPPVESVLTEFYVGLAGHIVTCAGCQCLVDIELPDHAHEKLWFSPRELELTTRG